MTSDRQNPSTDETFQLISGRVVLNVFLVSTWNLHTHVVAAYRSLHVVSCHGLVRASSNVSLIWKLHLYLIHVLLRLSVFLCRAVSMSCLLVIYDVLYFHLASSYFVFIGSTSFIACAVWAVEFLSVHAHIVSSCTVKGDKHSTKWFHRQVAPPSQFMTLNSFL